MRYLGKLGSKVAAGLAVALSACVLAAPGAGAATVVNGDFETGTLAGWQVLTEPNPMIGNWFAYSGTVSPLNPEFLPVPPPPAGNYAAVTDQDGPGTRVLYQDVGLEPYYSHTLSFILYQESFADLVTPSPSTLSSEGSPNQQYRVDVIKPSAAPDSVLPSDILATAYASATGGPKIVAPTTVSLDLSAFAGQTVRLRFAEVDNQNVFHAGVDSVAIQSTPPANAIGFGKVKLDKSRGSAKLTVKVPGPGTLRLADVKKRQKRVKAKRVTPSASGRVKIALQPTSLARTKLEANGKLKVKVAVTFTPTGGTAAKKTKTVTLRLSS